VCGESVIELGVGAAGVFDGVGEEWQAAEIGNQRRHWRLIRSRRSARRYHILMVSCRSMYVTTVTPSRLDAGTSDTLSAQV
jgi:hypothetical protein